MTFAYADSLENIAQALGYSDGTTQTYSLAQQYEIYRCIDDAVLYFRGKHLNYYTSDIAYKRPTASSYTTKTITIDGTDTNKATITLAGLNWRELVGATLEKTETSGTVRNIIREVVDTSTGEVRLLLPNEFTNGTITIKARCVRPSSRLIVERPVEVDGYANISIYSQLKIKYVDPEAFFSRKSLMYQTSSYPEYFTWVNDTIILDNAWVLSPSYTVRFKGMRAPILSTGGATNIDAPDVFQRYIELYAEGLFRFRNSEEQKGMMLMEDAKRKIKGTKRWSGAGSSVV